MSKLRCLAWVLSLAVATFGCAASEVDEPTETSDSQLALGDPHLTTARWEVQETGFWCGPAATRMALSALMASPPSQATLARELGTTTAGTDWIGQITTVLNARIAPDRYKTIEMPNDPPTAEQKRRLWADIVESIDRNHPVVTNIVAPPWNHPPGYPDRWVYHYFTVAGYDATSNQVYILDSANFSGRGKYWLSFNQLATLIPPKGYAALRAEPAPPLPPSPGAPAGDE